GTVSLLLSFLATLGMLVFSRPVSHALLGLLPERLRARPSARALCDALSVAISAQLGAAPALAFSFGTLPLLGLLANLPAVPLVGALLPLGWVSLLLGPIFSPLASLLAALCGAMANLLLHIAHAVAPLPFCQLALTEWYQFAGLAALWLLLAALAALRPARRTVVRALLLGCCPLLLAANLFALLSIPTAELVLSPTSGAAALVRRDSAVLLGAPKDARSAEEFSDALARLGVRRIEAILLADPIGAAQPIAALAARFGCDRLLAPDTNRVRGFCGSSGLTLCALPEDPVWLCGARLTLEAQTATFLFPDGTLLKTGAECAIISQYPRPLPSLGEGISRYRYTIPGG
ncbi:MAG: ComEC/Rec2 family competence protein, partial [Oscillospiraceae bacterium]